MAAKRTCVRPAPRSASRRAPSAYDDSLDGPDDLTVAGRVSVYASRMWEFVSGEPRESNTEGGLFPAIFGTVTLVLMTVLIFGLDWVFSEAILRLFNAK